MSARSLSICNPNPRKLSGPQLLHHLVPHQEESGAAAVEFTSEDGSSVRLEYDDLHRRANALAARIHRLRQPSADSCQRFIIPILLPQCLELYVSQLATLKAGGAFCPLVLDTPEERLRFILHDISARFLLTTAELKLRLPHFDDVCIIAVDDEDAISDHDTPFSPPSVSTQDPAYVMYTSGSTGQPKGVVLSHSAATQALLAHDLHIPKFSRFLQFASPTFDVSVFEIFFPWFRRATLVACDRKRLLNDLPTIINELGVDACELTPSVASSLLHGRESVPSLRILLTIGEMLKPSVVQEFGGGPGNSAILHGMYGPTEATIHCTLQTHFSRDMSCGNIGIPLDTVSAFIVKAEESDSRQAPVLEILPIGEEGELVVGGHQLADGYINREEQTSAAFIKHPEFGMLYRTGDRAKMLPDGKLECFGRLSGGQVKLRGQRIELGEIEHAASRTPGCRDVVAEVISGILVVFCVMEDAAVTESSILTTCREWLPPFMVPGDVFILHEMPYLASGKCDRKHLRQQYEKLQENGDPHDRDQHFEKTDISRIVECVLGVEVYNDSSLPGIGLDSLSAIQVASELSKAGFVQLDAAHILTARTPAHIASVLERTKNSHSKSVQVESPYQNDLNHAISNVLSSHLLSEIETAFPCTPVQTAMLTETSKDHGKYCNWVEFWLPQVDNSDILVDKIHAFAALHPMLRSGFLAITGTSWAYANITWKSLLSRQIICKDYLDYEMELADDDDLLHPCEFSFVITEGGSQLLLKLHHALYDQWSMDVFQVDLAQLLQGKVCRKPASFKMIADHYMNNLEQATSPNALDFWQETLRDMNPTSLPLLRGQEVKHCLSRTDWLDLSVQPHILSAETRKFGCSSPVLFQTAVSLMLGLYTGTTDITLGTVFSGRNLPIRGIEGVFGPCLSTLPFRIDYSTASTVRDLLQAVSDRNRAMQKYLLTPITTIRDVAGVAPGASIFDTIFLWQQSTLNSRGYSNAVQVVDSADQLEFNLVLEFEPSANNVKVRATYQESLIDASQIDLLLRQIDGLVVAMLQDPAKGVDDLLYALSPNLLSISNPDPTTYSTGVDLTALIHERAVQSPDKLAIIFAHSLEHGLADTVSLSYSQLDESANRMAHALIAAGVRAGDLVCICMKKCLELYVAMLATFKAGAGYLPLVPETPQTRIQSVLTQARVKLCICDTQMKETLHTLTEAVVMDITGFDIAVYSSKCPEVDQVGSRISYAVFTSGSTGEPKGVAVTMDNIQSNLTFLNDLYDVQPGDRLLQACSHSFDVSVFEIFFTFSTGMCLCSATKDVLFADFEHSVRTFEVTHLSLTPTVAALADPENVPTVRFLVTAGEAVTEKVHRRWAGRGLHQGYGPSETTNICSVKMNTTHEDVLGNIGPPLRNTSVFVVSPDKEFRILPSGSYGEYAFGGEQVFRGYIGREDLNDAKIIHHPRYGRLYRSGDMGRLLPDGTLLISGRLDDQVKIRGNRVELGEINSAVSNHSAVTDCVTLLLGENSSEQSLATFCVLSSQKKTEESSVSIVGATPGILAPIFDHLEDRLPTYMVPTFLVPITRLPMTSQGKLDKRLLQTMFQGLDITAQSKLAKTSDSNLMDMPSTAFERAIAEVVGEMLKIPLANISNHSSLLALGLNSLNAIQLAKLLQRKLQTRVNVATIFQNHSTARLGKALSMENCSTQSTIKLSDLLPVDLIESTQTYMSKQNIEVAAVLPCTPLQEAMLSASASSGSGAYCNTTKLTFSGDMQRLQKCWHTMTMRHSILRTCFKPTENAEYPFVQVVLKNPVKTWYFVEESETKVFQNGNSNGHPNANGDSSASSDKPPVSPESPVRVDVKERLVSLHLHHAVYDGIAINILFDELKAAYNKEDLPRPVSFEPFIQEVITQNGQQALQFWSERMQDFTPHPLPSITTASNRSEKVVQRGMKINPRDVDSFSERHACTNLAILQAAWAMTLSCAQDIVDVCFGNIVNGRSVAVTDVDRLVAPCFNTVPLRIKLDELRTNLDLIHVLHRYNLDSMSFQLTATRRIQQLSQYAHQPLYDSILLAQPPKNEDDPWLVEDDEMDMGVPIVLEITPVGSSYDLLLHYTSDKIPDATADILVDLFIANAQSCLQYPSNPVNSPAGIKTSNIAGKLSPTTHGTMANGNGSIEMPNGTAEHWSIEEESVRQVFASLASVEAARISRQTSLFQIGLDSLNAVQVASKLRTQKFEVDAADIMQHQTPAAIVSFLKSKRDETYIDLGQKVDLLAFDQENRLSITSSCQINERTLEAVRPCTPAQSGMLAQFVQSEGSHYVGNITYAIPEGYTFADIRAAWALVQRKHQVLRMGFYHTEDASSPFAMLIYYPDVLFDRICLMPQNDTRDSGAVAAQDILENIHLPAWRLTLAAGTGCCSMQLTLHHSLYDAESMRMLLSDFARALRLQELGPSYSIDETLRAQLERANAQKDEDVTFWQTSLNTSRVLKFPSLTSKVVGSPEMKSLHLSSGTDLAMLDTFCAREGITIQALGQTVWALLLAKYVGEPDVTFGTVFSGFSETSRMPAFPTISTVPVYCDTSQKTAVEISKSMVTYNASAQRHRFAALTDIQRYAGSPGQSLFDTLFVYQKGIDTEETFNWRIVKETLDIDFAVSMELTTSTGCNMALRLTYNTAFVPDAHASMILEQYDTILGRSIAADRKTEFKSHLLSHNPAKEATLPCPVNLLHEFVERGANVHPQKAALEFIHFLEGNETGSATWTYGQLNERGNQVAHLIQHHGVKPGGTVAVCMSKSAEASFAFVGILKAGCAFLAMDPDLPVARRSFIVEDSGSQLLFVDPGKTDPQMERVVRNVELEEHIIADFPGSAVDAPPAEASATSYCLYTSGTTGAPKGCELSHENAVQAIMAFQRLFADRWTELSRWLQFASYWFDVSVLEQFWSWSVGITSVSASRDLVLEDLAGFISRAKITHVVLTPSLAKLLKPEDAKSLHNNVFVTGGETLKQEIIQAWGPYKTVCNAYGPTEATIGVMMNRFIGPDAKPSNIGEAFDNVGAYVFKPGTDEMVLRGAVGELCLSGKLVGKGYLNRPDQTAKAFPYLDRYAERVYRTGDLVRLLADKSVSFVGRADTQTKLRGQRLEIDEIDTVIKASTSRISDVASLVTKSEKSEKEMLVSFIIDIDAKARDLQIENSNQSRLLVSLAIEACQDRLPGYMVPTHIIPVSCLPLTVNNKADTKKLVALFSSLSTQQLQELKDSGSSSRALRPAELKIARDTGKLLSINPEEIMPSSNLLSLGLSSITAINLASLLKRNGFENATVATIMKNPRLDRLAEALSNDSSDTKDEQAAVKQTKLSLTAFAHRHRATVAHRLSNDMDAIQSLTPCTALQEGLLTESLKGTKRPYFNHFWYDISALDTDRVRDAVIQLHRLVPILRTIFLRTEDGFIQVVLSEGSCSLKVVASDSEEFEKHLMEAKQRWCSQADQEVLRPFEATILRSTGKSMLAIHVHHGLYDGISWELTMEHLSNLYDSGSSNISESPSFTEALPYGPLSNHPGHKSFWHSYLQGADFSPLQRIHKNTSDSEVSLELKLSDGQAIEIVRKALGISHQAVVQTAFAVALHQFSPQTKSYGVVLSGRSIALDNADKVLGPMFNTVPTVVNLQPSATWSQQLQIAQRTSAEILPYQHTPLREIRKACGRHPSDPMFDVLFVFQRSQRSLGSQTEALFQPIDTQSPAEYPLAFEVQLDNTGNVSLTVVAQTAYANEASVQQLAEYFEVALRVMSQGVDQLITNDFSIVESDNAESSGKCRDSSNEGPPANDAHDFTWTAEARTLRMAMSELAGCDEDAVAQDSSIFTLGLDSIDAVKLAARLRKAHMTIPVSRILEAQTISGMLQMLDSQDDKAARQLADNKFANMKRQLSSLVDDQERPRQGSLEQVLPATPGQEALIADMVRSDLRDYYNADILRLHPDVDIEKLKSAWQQVIDASPILRTSFVEVVDPEIDATFAQIIHRPCNFTIPEIQYSTLSQVDQYLEEVRSDVARTLSEQSPLRLAIIHAQSEQYLILSLAHAQYDGHSLALLHEDIMSAYDDNLGSRPNYESFIESALEATSDAARQFWRNALTGANIRFFTDHISVASSKTHREERKSTINSQLARSICKKFAVSMQALAATAWALLLAQRLQDLDVSFGLVLACRDSEEAERVMFPTMNTVPMRAAIHGSSKDMMRHVQSVVNGIRPYQKTPLRSIQAYCASVNHDQESHGSGALFDTLFTYQHRPDESREHRASLYESVEGSSNVEYPVAVELEAVGNDIILRAAVKDHALDKSGTIDLLKKLDHVLDFLVNRPDEPTLDLSDNKASICNLPSFFIRDDDLKTTPTKTDAEDNDDEEEEDGSFSELPSTALLRSALAQVAKVPEQDISLTSTIESIGIDSISAIKVSALLRKQSIKLSVSGLLKAQTLRRMAELVEAKSESPTPNGESSKDVIANAMQTVATADIFRRYNIDADNVAAVMPATAGQQYMLAMWQSTGGELFYPTFEYHLKVDSTIDDVRAAWTHIVQRHAILRTTFVAGGAETPLLQVVLESVPSTFSEGDTTIVPKAANDQPMVQLCAIKNDQGFKIALRMHHALYDAVSLPILVQELQDILNGRELVHQKIAFQDYIALTVSAKAQAARKNFWEQYLQNISPTQPRPTNAKNTRKVEVFQPEVMASREQLEQCARKAGVSVQALLFALYARTSIRLATDTEAAKDVVFGIYLANRSHLPDLDKLAAPTLNLVPLAVRSPRQRGLTEIAKTIDADLRAIGSVEHASASLADIARWTGVKLDAFVNFLRLPGDKEASDSVTELNTWTHEVSCVREASRSDGEFERPSGLADFEPGEAYQHAVDVEFSLSDGRLSMGVFCLEAVLGLDEAEGLVAEFRRELSAMREID